MGGRLKFGPNAVFIPSRSYDYAVDTLARESFYKAIKRYLPNIELHNLQPDYVGIRPKLQKPGDAARDFIIKEETDNGLPGVINLLGIESPGLTSCLAIAEYVEKLADDFY